MNKSEEEIQKRIEEIRKKGEEHGTPENFFYGMLKSAHPNIVAVLEKEAAKFSFIGEELGKQINESEKDPEKKKQWISMLNRVEQGFKNETIGLDEDDTN